MMRLAEDQRRAAHVVEDYIAALHREAQAALAASEVEAQHADATAKHTAATKELASATDLAARHLEEYYTGLRATIPVFHTATDALNEFLAKIHQVDTALAEPRLGRLMPADALAQLGLPTPAEVGRAVQQIEAELIKLPHDSTIALRQWAAENHVATQQIYQDYVALIAGQRQQFNISTEQLGQWAEDSRVAFTQHQQMAIQTAAVVTTAVNKELEAYGFSQQALQAIYKSLIKDLADYLAHKAQMKALEQFAEALSSWPDVGAMAAHFAAAAAWEAVAAGISGAAGMLAGGGAGGAARRAPPSATIGPGAAQGPPQLAPGMAARQPGAQPQVGAMGHVTVLVMGTSQTARWLTSTINNAVVQQGMQLTSTRTKNPPYAAR
jgi:hypothetical protein